MCLFLTLLLATPCLGVLGSCHGNSLAENPPTSMEGVKERLRAQPASAPLYLQPTPGLEGREKERTWLISGLTGEEAGANCLPIGGEGSLACQPRQSPGNKHRPTG
uniref:Uncharacterized protein n=1 Tax=Chrysemys picta bellii TaxID=8478 RepID=A0A8C3I8K9_CHRPI